MLTEQMAEDMGLKEILIFDEGHKKMSTQYGYIPHRLWLEKEKERIESDPTRQASLVKKVVLDKYNRWVTKYALFVNPIAFEGR
jgi:hypothetical protein